MRRQREVMPGVESGGLGLVKLDALPVTLHLIAGCANSVLVLRGLKVAALLHVWSKRTPEHLQAEYKNSKNITSASNHSS